MRDAVKTYTPHAMTVFVSLVFLDNLRFKFTDAPETREIFGRLDALAIAQTKTAQGDPRSSLTHSTHSNTGETCP